MKKIYQLSMFLLIACLVIKESSSSMAAEPMANKPYDSSQAISLSPLLKEQAKILFGIGQKVDLKNFNIDTLATRKAIQDWNRYMAEVVQIVQQSDFPHNIACFVSDEECTIDGQKGVNVYKLSQAFIEIIQDLAKRLKRDKHNFAIKLVSYIPPLEIVLKDLKTQLNVIKVPKSQADAKNLITTLSSIYEEVLKKIKEDFGIKKSDITLNIDNAFKIVLAKDLTSGLDAGRKSILKNVFIKVSAFVDLSGSEDLPKIFEEYQKTLESVVLQINAMAYDFKPVMNQYTLEERQKNFGGVNKSIQGDINKAYNLVNKVSTYAASKREAKQVMLYLVEKYRQLVEAFKKQWIAEINKPQVGRPELKRREPISSYNLPANMPGEVESRTYYKKISPELPPYQLEVTVPVQKQPKINGKSAGKLSELGKKLQSVREERRAISPGKEEEEVSLVRTRQKQELGKGIVGSSKELQRGESLYRPMTKEEVQYPRQEYPPLK